MNLPVYKLVIDEQSEDLQVDAVALVDKPAIERNFLAFNAEFVKPKEGESESEFIPRCVRYMVGEGKDQEQAVAICYSMYENKFAEQSYSDYPESVSNNAKAALKWAEENGWGDCGTEVGKIRANQLAKGEPVSVETIRRMYSFLSRHKQNAEKSSGYEDGCGQLMYDAWGGASALSWAESKLKQIDKAKFAIQSEEERIITGPAMLADTPIYRNDERGEYYVVFDAPTIKKIAQKYFAKGFQNNVNLQHDKGQIVEGVTVFESWIVDSKRGIAPMKGFENVPEGSWFISMKVNDDATWQKVKAGEIKGFSVEGVFEYKIANTPEQMLTDALKNFHTVLEQMKTFNI